METIGRILGIIIMLGMFNGCSSQSQGVTDTEILIGTAQDLSGPLVNLSKPAVNGMQMRIREVNASGGIHGRAVKLIVEDHGYDAKKAVLAAQKMIQKDKIFATIGSIGTPTAMASMDLYLNAGVAHLFPLTGARQMFEPPHPLKKATVPAYYDQIGAALKELIRQKGHKRVCVNYQDDDFGLEIKHGGEEALKSIGMEYVEETTFKRGATDFSSQVAKLKNAKCDLVVMGTIIRETIGTVKTARALNFNPDFVGTVASYFDIIHKLGGKALNGYYAAGSINYIYDDSQSDEISDWWNQYKSMFDQDPTILSVFGYQIMDNFIVAAEAAGPKLDKDTLARAFEDLTIPADMFGADEQRFTRARSLGSNRTMLCQIQNQRWTCLTDYLTN